MTRMVGFGSDGKASACNAGDLGLIPRLERSPGEGDGNPLQCSCLENPMDRGALWATVHGVAKSQTRLSNFTALHFNGKTRTKCIGSSTGNYALGVKRKPQQKSIIH